MAREDDEEEAEGGAVARPGERAAPGVGVVESGAAWVSVLPSAIWRKLDKVSAPSALVWSKVAHGAEFVALGTQGKEAEWETGKTGCMEVTVRVGGHGPLKSFGNESKYKRA